MPTPANAPFLVHRGANDQVLLLCDHAGNAIPDELGGLGLSAAARLRHIAWDPGALDVALHLAGLLDADLLACPTSRLVVDPNRSPDHAELILAQSDGTFVPGNEFVSDAERQRRLQEYHAPYHAAITAAIEQRLADGRLPLLVSVHSFEPVWAGLPRPWPVGVLWKHDRRPVEGVLKALAADGTRVGDNQPYDGHAAMGYTLEHHGIGRGLPHILFELRNDIWQQEAACRAWAERLARALREGGMLATPARVAGAP